MRKYQHKYIAQGFLEDSSKLINEFMKLNSVEYEDFASVWKKQNFSLIFMGRPNLRENSEFVNEVFRITTQYFMEEKFLMHVGAVYTLYALFKNQITDGNPPIKIRLEMKHLKEIKFLRSVAIKENMKTLHYVIDYLIKEAFYYVANQTLRGPLIRGIPSPYDVTLNQLKEECAETFNDYYKSNNLKEIRDLHKEYLEAKKTSPGCEELILISDENIYDEAINKLESMAENKREAKNIANIESTRSKAEAFKKKPKKPKKKFTVAAQDLDVPVIGYCTKDGRVIRADDPVKKVRELKRPRKEDRKPGRPRQKPKPLSPPPEKHSSDDEIDITHLLTQQKAFYPPPVLGRCRAPRTRRDPYYQPSPPREDPDSESDPDVPSTAT